MKKEQPNSIIFIDGYCNLCNGLGRFIHKIDKKKQFKIHNLQSKLAEELIGAHASESQTIIVLFDKKTFYRSEAIFIILQQLGGLWKVFSKLYSILPKSLQENIYQYISKNRYSWFGRSESCQIPEN